MDYVIEIMFRIFLRIIVILYFLFLKNLAFWFSILELDWSFCSWVLWCLFYGWLLLILRLSLTLTLCSGQVFGLVLSDNLEWS